MKLTKNQKRTERRRTTTYIVPEMCRGCILIQGKKCRVQREPAWVYQKFKICWSKRTDPIVDAQIHMQIEDYKRKMTGMQ